MTQDSTEVQNLKTEYEAKVASDLSANTDEQAAIGEQIGVLRERLTTLEHEQAMLVGVQQAIAAGLAAAGVPATTSAAAPQTTAKGTAAPKVPRARGTKSAAPAAPAQQKRTAGAKKAAGAKKGTGGKQAASTTAAPEVVSTPKQATKPATKSAAKPAGKAAAKSAAKGADKAPQSAGPEAGRLTLRELIARQLIAHREPRSAAEVSVTLAEEHPDREIKGNVVRTTLEALVAKGLVHRSRQQKSVFYTHTDAARTQLGEEPAGA